MKFAEYKEVLVRAVKAEADAQGLIDLDVDQVRAAFDSVGTLVSCQEMVIGILGLEPADASEFMVAAVIDDYAEVLEDLLGL